ncbi:TMV resistance protein N-like [Abrus precatorius]|uniref:TMV resistance protein N-like n=1 Tax=Abrus precatorius TaxID=3816 RepID=A0A8B8LPI0_ABRPR|nr:TMV resistance protein N-like [Abrus precatorius]
MAASSSSNSSFSHGWFYHVFLSFRGEDTRDTFAGNLYNALDQRGINTFIDDEGLRIGEEISPSLLRAIEESMISIIIFSKNYASSTWCLDELVKILECKKYRGQVVFLVFYNVSPANVRHQKGSYEEAFVKLEERFKENKEKVQKWRSALSEAANLSGWHFSNGYEFKFIQKIVDEVSRKLNRIPLNVARHPVGLQARVSDVNSLLELGCDDVRMVGIYGIGGIGKTTIAKAVYNTVSDQFQHASFLANVRENASHRSGLVKLQEKLLFEILGEKTIKLGNVDKGINIIKERLCRKRVLLVLDNVDDVEQLQALAGGLDWFGLGSRIIITTRDKHLLTAHQIDLAYEVKKLNHLEALQLFSWNAFKQGEPDARYFDISNRAVCYAEGLPLALKILGSDLCGRSIHQWESALDKYKRTPNRKVQDILKISFDGLEENEKEIFLYIACFFKGEIMEYAVKALRACDLHPAIGIAILVDKSLINVDERGTLSMHDLIQDMGKEIVRQESPLDPGQRSRLWYYEDVLQVLTEGKGTDKIQGIMLNMPEKQEVQLKAQDLKRMKNLRMLIVRNAEFFGGLVHLPTNLRMLDWEEYPSTCLPSDFLPEKIVMLELKHSHLTLDRPFKKHVNLTSLNLSSCEFLTKIPDISGIPNLEQLILEDCTGLVEIHESLGSLDKLVYLGVERCTDLKKLPCVLQLPSLACIALNGCSQLEKFPALLGKMENLRIIEMEETAIQELPSYIVNFSSLEILVLKCCSNLKDLPRAIDMLPNLQLLDISGCPHLQLFPEKICCCCTQHCSTLHPQSNESSSNLELLTAGPEPCLDLISPGIHSSYGFPLLDSLDLCGCNLSDKDLHILSFLSNLTSLDISRNHFVTLPKCFNRLCSLQELYMANCRNVQYISGIPPNLEHIDATSCTLLNLQSLSLLLSQRFYKTGKYEVIAPRPVIPLQFSCQSKGGSLSFWIGQKFPRIALCFIFGLGNKIIGFFTCEVQLFINGQKASNRVQHFLSVCGDLAWMYHQEDVMDLNTYLLHEQNHVEVSCEIVDTSKAAKVMVYCSGVHEYKEDEELKKRNLMLCTSSNPSSSDTGVIYIDNEYFDNTQFARETDNYDGNPGIDCWSLAENLRIHEISDEQMQQISASINPGMLEDNDLMDQNKRRNGDVLWADEMHQNKEMSLLHLQLYNDITWDPMLLECQLNHMTENQPFPIDCQDKEVRPTQGRDLAPTKAVIEASKTVVLKEDSESHMKIRTEYVESQRTAEAPIIATNRVQDMGDQHDHRNSFPQTSIPQFYVELSENSFYLRNRKQNSWHEAEASISSTCKSEPTQKVPPTIHPAENIVLVDQESELEGPSVKEYETKRDEIKVIPLEYKTCQFDLNLRDDNMEAFYAALHAETTPFSLALGDDDDVSLNLKSLIIQLSADFSQWSWDYIDATMKLKSSTAGLSKLDTLEEGLIANKNQFMARDTALRKKRETFEEGRMLKAQRDELRKRRPRLRAEQESAKSTKANIEDEWSKIREKFDKILHILGS